MAAGRTRPASRTPELAAFPRARAQVSRGQFNEAIPSAPIAVRTEAKEGHSLARECHEPGLVCAVQYCTAV